MFLDSIKIYSSNTANIFGVPWGIVWESVCIIWEFNWKEHDTAHMHSNYKNIAQKLCGKLKKHERETKL